MKKIAFMLAAAVGTVFTLSGCSGTNKMYTIGVVNQASYAQTDAMYGGFVQALAENGYVEGENLKIDYYDCSNDDSKAEKAVEKIVSKGENAIFAITEAAAKTAADGTSSIPIIAGAVNDFEESGLTAENITGTSDMIPVEEQIDVLHKLAPQAVKLAIVYNQNADYSVEQANRAAVQCGKYGMTYKFMPISYEGDAEQVMYNIIGAFDAVYMPSDSVVYNCIEVMGEFTDKGRVPVIVGDEGMLEKYGLATVAVSYEALGRQSGEMAAKILGGESPSNIPVEKNKNYKLIVDESRKKALGITADVSSGEIAPLTSAAQNTAADAAAQPTS